MPDEHSHPNKNASRRRLKIPAIFPWAATAFVIALAAWLIFPRAWPAGRRQPEPTQAAPPTQTPAPTRTAQPAPSLTPTLAPSATAFPDSAYYLPEGAGLRPPIPGVESGVIVLDEASSAVADPPFASHYWSSSSDISAQTGFFIDDPYYATFGAGSVTWKSDVPLAAGIYELYVMDTLYSSAGPLDFQVSLDSSEIRPILGQQHVEFYSSRGEPLQTGDLWRSIGLYDLEHPGLLSVSTRWAERDERSLVAIDRVVIVPLPASTRLLLSALPKDRNIVILDDLLAEIETRQILFPETGALSWGDQFQYLVNPDHDVRVRWTTPDFVAPGQYQVAAWLPAVHATQEVTYRLLIDGAEPEGSEVQFNQGGQPGGRWVTIGVWETPRIYEKPLRLTLEMEIKGGRPGEVAIDAVALIRTP